MSSRIFLAFMLFENVLIGGFFLLYPRIARRGLLFGVYVGEEAHESDRAREITRSWYRAIVACLVGTTALGGALALSAPHPPVAAAPPLLLLLGFLAAYLRAYRQARTIAPVEPPSPGVAPLVPVRGPGPLLPALTLTASVALGVFAVGYAASHYADLPARVPTHFGPSGTPDAWRPKSFFTVMLLPILASLLGVGLGGAAWLTAHAKRALRRSDDGASLAAQERFRSAMTRFLCGIALLVVGMLTLLSVSSIRVGLGLAAGLGPSAMVSAGLVVAYGIGGALYLAVRYGQGGSRLEAAGPGRPLTDGLADNRHWVLGMFYVNRDDPSFLVEHRFGLGYTFNLGNWRAVTLLAAFLVAVIGCCIAAILTN